MSKSESASHQSSTTLTRQARDTRILLLIAVLLSVVITAFYSPDFKRYMDSTIATTADKELNRLVLATTSNKSLRLAVDVPQGVISSKPTPSQTLFFFKPVPINFADKNLLTSVSGVGPVLADRILKYRRVHGNLEDYRRLLEVQGVGPQKLMILKNAFSYETEW